MWSVRSMVVELWTRSQRRRFRRRLISIASQHYPHISSVYVLNPKPLGVVSSNIVVVVPVSGQANIQVRNREKSS
jgi:hypothetical protein